jgi:hypothetical protein
LIRSSERFTWKLLKASPSARRISRRDHLVLGLRVAVDLDPFDIGALGFGDVEVHAHRQRIGVLLELRVHVGEGVAEQACGLAQVVDRVLDELSVVPVALLQRQRGGELLAVEVPYLAVDAHVAELVAFPLLHHIGDDEVLLVGRQLGDRGGDAKIGIALRQVELPQLLLVVAQAILVVAGRRRQQPTDPRLLGRHLRADLRVGEDHITEDVDLADLRLRPFADLEHDVHAVLVQRHHLRIDHRRETALAPVQFEDPADILPDRGARKDLARGELDLLGDLVALQRLVTLDDHAVDDRVLADAQHDVAIRNAGDRIIREQVAGLQILQRLVERLGGVRDADAQLGVAQHRIGFDPLRSLHAQRLDRAGGSVR